MNTHEEGSPELDQQKILEKIRNSALYLLTRREHTSLELKQKLSRKGYQADDINNVLTRLTEAGLIDSRRFAESYTRYRRSRGFGPQRISMELHSRGVPDGIIAELVQIADNAWFTDARDVWHKKFNGCLPTDSNERAKQMRFLYNRGFTQEQINRIYKDPKDD